MEYNYQIFNSFQTPNFVNNPPRLANQSKISRAAYGPISKFLTLTSEATPQRFAQ